LNYKTFTIRWGLSTAISTAMGCALALSAAVPAAAQMPVLPPPPAGYVFPAHQTLTFKVDWRVFTAGTAVFHLETQGTQEKITASADTIGAVNMLFPVEDRYQSAFDTRTGCSASFNKQIFEGRRKINSDLSFNYATGKQDQTEKNVVKGTVRQTESPIPACVTDSLSAIFYVASQRLTDGTSFSFPLGDAARTVPVTMKVMGHEEIKTPSGTYQTVRVQPTTDASIVKNRGNILIWYTDDARHLPVQIRAFLFWGTITFHLQSVEDR